MIPRGDDTPDPVSSGLTSLVRILILPSRQRSRAVLAKLHRDPLNQMKTRECILALAAIGSFSFAQERVIDPFADPPQSAKPNAAPAGDRSDVQKLHADERISLPDVDLNALWHSYGGHDVDYERFYRVTILQINSPRACIGIFVGEDELQITWAYTEYENGIHRRIIARKEAGEEVRVLADKLKILFDSPGDGPFRGLDGRSVTVELLRPEVKDPVKKTSWQMSAAKGSEPYEEIQIGLVRIWNDLPGTIDLKDFE